MTEQTTAEKIAVAGIKRPMNWDEMGSSAKDLWEERMLRSIAATSRRKEQRA